MLGQLVLLATAATLAALPALSHADWYYSRARLEANPALLGGVPAYHDTAGGRDLALYRRPGFFLVECDAAGCVEHALEPHDHAYGSAFFYSDADGPYALVEDQTDGLMRMVRETVGGWTADIWPVCRTCPTLVSAAPRADGTPGLLCRESDGAMSLQWREGPNCRDEDLLWDEDDEHHFGAQSLAFGIDDERFVAIRLSTDGAGPYPYDHALVVAHGADGEGWSADVIESLEETPASIRVVGSPEGDAGVVVADGARWYRPSSIGVYQRIDGVWTALWSGWTETDTGLYPLLAGLDAQGRPTVSYVYVPDLPEFEYAVTFYTWRTGGSVMHGSVSCSYTCSPDVSGVQTFNQPDSAFFTARWLSGQPCDLRHRTEMTGVRTIVTGNTLRDEDPQYLDVRRLASGLNPYLLAVAFSDPENELYPHLRLFRGGIDAWSLFVDYSVGREYGAANSSLALDADDVFFTNQGFNMALIRADAWGLTHGEVPEEDYFAMQTDLAVAGDVAMTWRYPSSGDLRFARRPPGGPIGPVLDVDGPSEWTSVALCADGAAQIAYRHGSEVRLAIEGDLFVTETIDTPFSADGKTDVVCLDDDDVAVVFDADGGIAAAWRDDGNWHSEVVSSTHRLGNAAFGPGGAILVAATDTGADTSDLLRQTAEGWDDEVLVVEPHHPQTTVWSDGMDEVACYWPDREMECRSSAPFADPEMPPTTTTTTTTTTTIPPTTTTTTTTTSSTSTTGTTAPTTTSSTSVPTSTSTSSTTPVTTTTTSTSGANSTTSVPTTSTTTTSTASDADEPDDGGDDENGNGCGW